MNPDDIRQFPLFANLPRDELTRLAQTLPECSYHSGEIVFAESSMSDHFFLILSGEVEIIKSLGTPDERVVALSNKGSLLGEMSMFSQDGRHTASVRAKTPITLLRITNKEFDDLLKRNPYLAYDLLSLYSSRLAQSESLTIQDLREKNRQLTLAYEELKAAQAAMIEKEKLEHELEIAAEIQQSILPEMVPAYPGWDFGGLMVPNRQVGGDFYDFIQLDDHRIGIVVGDVCDKGMAAALFMILTCSSVRVEAQRHDSPGDTLRAVNHQLLQVNRSGMFVTLLYGILDCQAGTFTYARAGHPPPMLIQRSVQSAATTQRLGQPVGLFEDFALDEQILQIPPGSTLMVYSDGLSETVDAISETSELSGFCSNLLQGLDRNAQAFCDLLWQSLGGATAESLIQDDFTVVIVKNLRPQ